MKKLRSRLVHLAAMLALVLSELHANAGFGTSVPISAELATSIARSMFPQGLVLARGNLLLSDPAVVFVDMKRVAVRMHVQAYDYRPEAGVALSEDGRAVLSGEVGWDVLTRQILLYNPRLDELVFDRETAFTGEVRGAIAQVWQDQVSNPVRADLPPHPYILPFEQGIQDISYGSEGIVIQVWYE